MDRDSRDASSYAAGSNHLGALSREQSIEFNRRRDICYSVVATTGTLFSERKKLLDQLSAIDHPSRRRTALYITLLAVGALLDYLIRDGRSGFDPNFGTAIWAAAILMAMQKTRERSKLAARLTVVLDQLRLAERTWLSGGGDSNEFWDLAKMLDSEAGTLDVHSDRYHAWSRKVNDWLLCKVDGGIDVLYGLGRDSRRT